MSEDEMWAFLDADPPRPAVVATVRSDGRPHAVPVWYATDAHTLVFMTGEGTVKGRALRRDPWVAMCVDDDRPPFSFVSIEGDASVSDELTEVRRFATLLGGRYMGAARAEEFGARNGVPGELLVRVHPRTVVAFRDVAD
jgi:PPOX class probable F420-dependent enzyme